ncbi:DNA-binding protein [Luteimonas sp. MJ250]|uniref:DNA-binding protein n=1 Tax=Luteimonas sp. MJ250 TaxID=3129236 RepID=UPI0031BB4F5C
MARGITESDVHTAADEIVAAGERPTVERIRAHLGTGSPNTVTRWLETWWQRLGQRLQAQQVRLSVPAAPDAVAALAGDLWRLALKSASDTTQKAVAADRTALQEAQAALQAEHEAFVLEASALRSQVDAATHSEHLASAQAAELKRLVNQLEGQLTELAHQRDAAMSRAADAESAWQAAERRLQDLQDAGQSEREALTNHVRATEDRAHAEVDRARQESRELKSLLSALQKEHAAAEKSHLRAVEQSNTKAIDAQRQAEVQRARADAVEKQLAKLQDLPAALEAAVRRNSPSSPRRKPATKKGGRSPRNRVKVSEPGAE